MAVPQQAPDSVRLDRWLFAVRLFRSRSLAAAAIAGGKVKVNGDSAKAHYSLKRGDEVVLKREGRTFTYRVEGLLEKRVGAAEAVQQYHLTEDADLDPATRAMVQLYREIDGAAPKTRGKPSKKDRRLLNRLKQGSDD